MGLGQNRVVLWQILSQLLCFEIHVCSQRKLFSIVIFESIGLGAFFRGRSAFFLLMRELDRSHDVDMVKIDETTVPCVC
jgi:hypothetical protein